MHRANLTMVMRIFAGTVALASCAEIAAAAPAINQNPPSIKEPAPALAVEQVRVPLSGIRDEAAMVLVGTALIALAAAVRRSA